MSLLLLLAACGSAPPTIDLADPSSGRPGEPFKLIGSDFDPAATATLGGKPVSDLSVRGVTMVEGTVPSGSAPGEQPLVVQNPDGQQATVTFTVAEPPAEIKLCSKDYTAYTQLAAGRKLIKIDRHHKDPKGGDPTVESLSIAFDDVDGVEYEGHVQGDAYCSAIILRLTNGSREVYEDSRELDLKKKSQELAQAMSKGIDVVHEDERPKAEE